VAIIPNLTSPVFLWKYSARFYLQENFSLSAAVLRGFLKPSTARQYHPGSCDFRRYLRDQGKGKQAEGRGSAAPRPAEQLP
ncbi:MAG: hypothetical protein WC856_25470, partial [Methylococcaceae bacterium]